MLLLPFLLTLHPCTEDWENRLLKASVGSVVIVFLVTPRVHSHSAALVPPKGAHPTSGLRKFITWEEGSAVHSLLQTFAPFDWLAKPPSIFTTICHQFSFLWKSYCAHKYRPRTCSLSVFTSTITTTTTSANNSRPFFVAVELGNAKTSSFTKTVVENILCLKKLFPKYTMFC